MFSWYNNMGFRWKLTLPLMLLVIIFIGVSVYAVRATTALGENSNTIATVNLPEIQLLLEADRDLYQALTAERAMLVAGSVDREALLREHQENAQQTYDRAMQSFDLSQIVTQQERQRFESLYDRWFESSTAVIEEARTAGPLALEPLASRSFGEVSEAFSELRNHLDVVSERRLQQVDSLNQQINEDKRYMISALSLSGILGTLISLGAAAFLPMLVTRPLNQISARIQDIAEGDGDLTLRVNLDRTDELGQLAEQVNRFMARLQRLIGDVRNTTEEVSTSTEQVLQASTSSQKAADEQGQAINMVVAAVNELTAAIGEVAQNTNETAESAKNANQTTEDGRNRLERAVRRVDSLASHIGETAESMRRLEEEAQNVTSVIDVIRGVAEQTNLLALNAAIEAARAGEQGRGFAVVADEVRTLASRTQQSTEDIRNMLTRLQGGVQEAVEAMSSSRELTDEAVSAAGEAGESLVDIAEAVQRITNMAIQIASAAEEQSTVTGDIDKNMVEINELASRTSDDAATTAVASERLMQLASSLRELVVRFKV
ncbi:methyl-accepting chemotaxis protein [Marinimicrobium locisalis]|uniref:methyl-accepting chemotaxis protein n=1 Tax=Marinimicrobium locisalis TaxID=546022 RepID=UPI003221B995